jgi:predicted methyltransferase
MSIRIVTGDCREVMQSFETNSIDAIVTDPP